jgi:hypothetical protein
MNNQIILSALESQLATKKSELESHSTLISEPASKALTQNVLQSLRETVSPLIPNIMLDRNRLEIMKSGKDSWSSITVYLDHDWRSEETTRHAKINWYASSATLKDENTLNDLQIFGAVAAKLAWIEYEFVNNWRPAIVEIDKIPQNIENEIRQISYSIQSVKNQMRNDGIDTYKQEGFTCTLTPTLNISRDWDVEGTPHKLQSSIPNIQLSTGRGKWDYVYAKSFKVLKTNKYKTTLEVTQSDDRVIERTVTARSFDQFISEVYDWQTEKAKVYNDKITERFNTQYAKQSV